MTKESFIGFVILMVGSGAALPSGGWGCGGQNRTGINASIAVPFELLTIENYQVEITLIDPSTEATLQGPVALAKDADNETWEGELFDVGEEQFLAIVEIRGPVEDGDPVLLAQAIRDVTIPKGAPFATITFKPLDFDTDLDDDGDALTNTYEYVHGSDPYEAGGVE
jgi:hypothetical protein